MAEDFGVRGRGRFYEETGAIRDVIQNHLLQVTAVLTMDGPVGQNIEAVRNEKARVLDAIAPLDAAHVVRGQYRGYRDETGVSPSSTVETFAAVQLRIDTWRWADVPFFIRAGKRMAANVTEVVAKLKNPARDIFGEHLTCTNYLRLRIGPDQAIAIGVRVRRPGAVSGDVVGQEKELIAAADPARAKLPYARLLDDAMHGDQTLFAREDEINAQWRVVEPVLGDVAQVYGYDPGTWGPPEAGQLWPRDCHNPVVSARVP